MHLWTGGASVHRKISLATNPWRSSRTTWAAVTGEKSDQRTRNKKVLVKVN